MAATSKKSDQPMKSANLYIILALVTLLAMGVAFLFGKNLLGNIVLDTKVISAKSAANKQLSSDLQAAPQLVDSYNALGTEQKTLSDAMPLYSDFPDLLVTLENMGNDSGLTLSAIGINQSAANSGAASASTTQSSTSGPSPQVEPISITYEGSYTSLNRMLTYLETSARPMRVLDVSASGSGSDLTGTIDVNTYYQTAATMPFGMETIQ